MGVVGDKNPHLVPHKFGTFSLPQGRNFCHNKLYGNLSHRWEKQKNCLPFSKGAGLPDLSG
jgi:hypothetical protein